MKRLIKVMKALSDPNRLKIFKILQNSTLQNSSMCVCEIQFSLGLAQSSISKHLKILEEADLVESKKSGLWVDYFISNNADNQYAVVMSQHLKKWINEDPELSKVLEKASIADREKICKG